ncbi:hypothetical protein MC885_004087 [Smutsia gigantea]|nr:hypothetical protein MC885_004087 [Smutsia gigantea]
MDSAGCRQELLSFSDSPDNLYTLLAGAVLCQILPKGVVAVLGPSSSPASSSIISNICGEKEVPHFKVAPEEFIKFQLQRFTTLNLHPSNTDISVAVAGILNFFNCTTACLICAKAEWCEMAEHRRSPGEAEPTLVPERPPTAQVGLSDHTVSLLGELIQ